MIYLSANSWRWPSPSRKRTNEFMPDFAQGLRASILRQVLYLTRYKTRNPIIDGGFLICDSAQSRSCYRIGCGPYGWRKPRGPDASGSVISVHSSTGPRRLREFLYYENLPLVSPNEFYTTRERARSGQTSRRARRRPCRYSNQQ